MPYEYSLSLSTLEWLSAQSSQFYVVSVPVIFILLCAEEYLTTKYKISKSLKWTALACAVLCIILVYTALYIQWTPVGAAIVNGVQSRYFLPFLLFVPLACLSTTSKTSKQNRHIISSTFLFSIIIFINMNALAAVIFSHL